MALKLLCPIIHMLPYRFQRVQMLHVGDHQQRIGFANEYLIRYDGDNDWLLRTLWTDEAHFTLTGKVNTKHCVQWADMNSHAVVLVPLDDAKATVWCGIAGTIVLDPYFFEEATPTGFVTCSVTGSRYATMLQNYVIPEFLQRNALNEIFWVPNGATPQLAAFVSKVL